MGSVGGPGAHKKKFLKKTSRHFFLETQTAGGIRKPMKRNETKQRVFLSQVRTYVQIPHYTVLFLYSSYLFWSVLVPFLFFCRETLTEEWAAKYVCYIRSCTKEPKRI